MFASIYKGEKYWQCLTLYEQHDASRLHVHLSSWCTNAVLASNSLALRWCIVTTLREGINPTRSAWYMNAASLSYSPVLHSCIMLTNGCSALKHYAAFKGLTGICLINPTFIHTNTHLPCVVPHRVRTGFQVVDPAVEASQARLEAMRTGRQKLTPASKTKKVSPRIITITAGTSSF